MKCKKIINVTTDEMWQLVKCYERWNVTEAEMWQKKETLQKMKYDNILNVTKRWIVNIDEMCQNMKVDKV